MKPSIPISLANVGPAVTRFIQRFGLLIIFIIIAIGLAISVFMLNSVIMRTDQANGYTPQETSVTFDEETVEKIESLKMDGEQTDRADTSGRLLPF